MIYEYNSILKPYIADFLNQKKSIVSDCHYAHYCGILQNFDAFIIEYGYEDINFNEEQILCWIATLKLKRRTVNYYCSTLRVFFNFLSGYGFQPFAPPYIKEEKDYIAYGFSDTELKDIFSIADNYAFHLERQSPDKPHHAKKYMYSEYEFPMLLRLLLGCGLRLEEASMLKLKDVNLSNDTLTIRKSKSNEYRFVPMHPSVADILAKYCTAIGLGAEPDAYIFPGTDFSRPIPSNCFRSYFNTVLKKAGILPTERRKHERGPCLHCLRHAFAHRSFKNGVGEGWAVNDQIPWLSVYLGHSNLQETERYLNFNCELISDEITPFDRYSTDLYPEVNFNE